MIYIVMISQSMGVTANTPPPNLNPKEARLINIALFSITYIPPTSNHKPWGRSQLHNTILYINASLSYEIHTDITSITRNGLPQQEYDSQLFL